MGRVTATLEDGQHEWVSEIADEIAESQAEVMRRCISHARETGAFNESDSNSAGDAPSGATKRERQQTRMMQRRITALARGLDVDLVAELVREDVAALEMPGRTEADRDAQRDAVVAASLHLRDAESAPPREIRRVYEDYDGNYANPTQWWEGLNPILKKVEPVEQVTMRRWEWVGY